MMAITTNNSISVNPRRFMMLPLIDKNLIGHPTAGCMIGFSGGLFKGFLAGLPHVF
jgi:hypothetical protein